MDQHKILEIYEDDKFLKKFFNNNKNILKALKFARFAHRDQKRKSGLPFIIHPIYIAINTWEKFQNEVLTISSLLHDTVEDCEDISIEEIYIEFGDEVGFIVDALNKKEKSFLKFPEKIFDDKIERLLWGGTQNVKILLVKIIDRQHNLESLEFLKENKQIRMTFETQAIYEPLKKILDFDKNDSIKNIQKSYSNFLSKHKLNIAKKTDLITFKNYLFRNTFNKLNDDSFKIVYDNAEQVTWQINGWEIYNNICENPNFKNKINILNVKSDGDSVKVNFKFKKGIIPTQKNILKMEISTFSEK